MNTQENIKDDVLKFLHRNTTAVVASSFNDNPRASTVYFYVDDNFTFYFITKRNTSKYMNVELNPRAAIVVGTGPEHISVQAHGTVELIVDEEERQKINDELNTIQAREHIKIWPIEELENFKDRNKVVFKITPEELFFMNLDSKDYPESISDKFVKII